MPEPEIKLSLLFPDAAAVIREAAQGATAVKEANPMTVRGGRVPKTDHETLATLNAPCSTCGHSYLAHNLEDKKQCFFCTPKGSQHGFHESPDMSPHLLKVPTLTSEGNLAKPEEGITGMAHSGRMAESSGHPLDAVAADQEAALDRLLETYFSSDVSPDVKDNKNMDGQRKALMLYNAHSIAAHRSSTMAYSSGGDNSAAHQVAAEHHRLAAQAADDAANKHSNARTKKDLQTASKYHNAQATAHKAAAQTQQSGNRQPYSYETSGRDY